MKLLSSAIMAGITVGCAILQIQCSPAAPDDLACGAASPESAPCGVRNFEVVVDPPAPLIDGNSDPADWPSYGHDLWNTRHNPLEPDHTSVRLPRVLWRADLGDDITGTPVVAGGVVYAGATNGQVGAFDAISGAPIWSINLNGEIVSASLAVSGSRVFVSTLAGKLWALNRATGATLWQTDLTFGITGTALYGSPVLADGSLYIGVASDQIKSTSPTFRGSTVALDPETGAIRWTTFLASGAERGAGVWGTPAVRDGRVYIGSGQSLVDEPVTPYSDATLALQASNGSILWYKQFWPNDSFTLFTPLSGPDYDMGASPNLYWIGSRAVVGGGSKSGDYHVRDAATGEKVWSRRYTNGSLFGGFLASTAYAQGRIHAAVNSLISQIDPRPLLIPTGGKYLTINAATGAVLHSQVALPSFSAPCIAGGVVYYSDLGGTIWARRADSGAILWALPTLEPSSSGPSISRGRLYIGTGTVSAIVGGTTGIPVGSISHHLLAIAIDGQ